METTFMLRNVCWGGFTFSDKAIKEYTRIKQQTEPSFFFDGDAMARQHGTFRFDPIMIDIVRRFGKSASSEYSDIRIEEVIKELVPFIKLDDYDGMESYEYDVSAYLLSKIKEHVYNPECDATEKVDKIKSLLELDMKKLTGQTDDNA